MDIRITLKALRNSLGEKVALISGAGCAAAFLRSFLEDQYSMERRSTFLNSSKLIITYTR